MTINHIINMEINSKNLNSTFTFKDEKKNLKLITNKSLTKKIKTF